MRTRKPAATSGGPACHRCTALLHAGITRCSMCGWPAGVGYPPADGELDQVAAPPAPEPDTAADDEHTAAQLDALAGMAQRQTQPLAPETNSVTTSESTSETPPAEATDAEPVEAAKAEPTAPPEQAAESAPEPAPQSEAPRAAAEIDPLTAPLEELTNPQSPIAAPEPVATPVFDETSSSVEETAVLAASDEERHVAPIEPAPLNDLAPTPAAPPAAGRAASLARPAQLLIVAAAMLNLVLAGMQLAFGDPIDASMTTVVLGVSLLALAVWTAAAVTFLYWVSRAYEHVAAYSSYRQRHGNTLALAGWLIPVAGFVIGYRVLQDLWTGSNPETRNDPDAKPTGARVIDLWLLGIVTACLFAYVMPLALGDSTLWSGIAALGIAIAGLTLASTISTVSTWQADDDAVADAEAMSDAVVGYENGTVSTRVDDLETVSAEGTAPVGAPQSVSANSGTE